MTNLTLDTTVIVKALVRPQRKHDDPLFREQMVLHIKARSYIERIEARADMLHIPSMALIETAAVVSRLTGSEELGKESATFLVDLAESVVYDIELLGNAVAIAAKTKVSGFDIVFLTCAQMTNSVLVTDDRKMHDTAVSLGIPAVFLRSANR